MIKFYKLHTALNGSDNFLMELNHTSGKIVHIEINPFDEPEIVRIDVEFRIDKVQNDMEFFEEFRHLEIR